MKYKEGDYVKIKDGKLFENFDDIARGWGGVIELIEEDDEKYYIVEFDADTLASLSDEYFEASILSDSGYSWGQFTESELDGLQSKRMNWAAREDIMLDMDERALAVIDNSDEFLNLREHIQSRGNQRWLKEFTRSNDFNQLTDFQKGFAESAIREYLQQMELHFSYDDWVLGVVKVIFLEFFPQKAMMIPFEELEHYEKIFNTFFSFLGNQHYINNAKNLCHTVQQVAPEMLRRASTPGWYVNDDFLAIAKTLGIDTKNQEAMDIFAMQCVFDKAMEGGYYEEEGFEGEFDDDFIDDELSPNTKFKKDTYVSIKDGIAIENTIGETKGWAGLILEFDSDKQRYLVDFDASTLLSFNEEYLNSCLEAEIDFSESWFDESALSAIPDREYDWKANNLALDQVDTLALKLLEGKDELSSLEGILLERRQRGWIFLFGQSDFFNQLTQFEQENARFAIECFQEYAFNYFEEWAADWTSSTVEEVCLDILPRKVSTEIELFESYSDILAAYFDFLGQQQYINNAEELSTTVRALKHKIPQAASDPSNWGIAKSLMRGAQSMGYDTSDQVQLNQFMLYQNLNQAVQRQDGFTSLSTPHVNEFKNIGRNDKVTVKYLDGTIKEAVKFKKVKQDLEEGKCELMS